MNFTSILTIAVIIVVFFVLFKIFKLLMRLLLVAVFLVLAYLTNPDIEKHRIAVREKTGPLSMLFKNITVENYYVCSITYSGGGNDKKIIGAGAFTQVFIFRNP